jgi:hypothetical protein
MINVTRDLDRDLEVDVLALQALSSSSQLLSPELGMLGGNTACIGTVVQVCCGVCTALTNVCTECTVCTVETV